MGSYTSPDSLYKPAVGEEDWGLAVDENFDTIQAALTALRTPPDVDQLAFGISTGIQITVPNGWYTPLDFSDYANNFGELNDPQGWADPDPFVSDFYEVTFPAYTTVILPPGLYWWNGYANLTTTPADPATWLLFPDWVNTVDAFGESGVPAIDVIFGNTFYAMAQGGPYVNTSAKAAGFLKLNTQNQGMFRIPDHRADGITPVTEGRVGFLMGLHDDTQDRTTTYVNFVLAKVA